MTPKKTIKEAVDTMAMETARLAKEALAREPRRPGFVVGLGDCALSHGVKVARMSNGNMVMKARWPGPSDFPSGDHVQEHPVLGTRENDLLLGETIERMREGAGEGTERAFRAILDALLVAGVHAETLVDEVHAALARSVLES